MNQNYDTTGCYINFDTAYYIYVTSKGLKVNKDLMDKLRQEWFVTNKTEFDVKTFEEAKKIFCF